MSDDILLTLRSQQQSIPLRWLNSPTLRRLLQREETSIKSLLIEGYLNSEMPVHCRRTLDQYSYHMLDTNENRDLDQVIYKWVRKEQRRHKRALDDAYAAVNRDLLDAWTISSGIGYVQKSQMSGEREKQAFRRKAKHRPMIMVDQLWLWVLTDGWCSPLPRVLITCSRCTSRDCRDITSQYTGR